MIQNTNTHVISTLLVNKPGSLMRVCQIFTRRGFNIDSLVVCPAMDGRFSRITVTSTGNPDNLDQIIRQLNKLIDVVNCVEHSKIDSIVRELVLVKVRLDNENRDDILHIADHFGAKTVDITLESCVIQCSGSSEKIDRMISLLGNFDIVEIIRSGKMLMARGEEPT